MKLKLISPILIIFLTVFIDMVGFGIVIPILPLYSEKFGATPFEIGLLLGVFSLMQLFFSPILGQWSDRVGRRPVLLCSLLGTALGFLILGIAHTLALLFIGRIIDGITGGNIPTAQAYIADVTPPEQRSKTMGIIGAAFGLGFMLGPAIGGLLGHLSYEAPFLFAAGLSFLNACALFFCLPESLPPEKRGQTNKTGNIWQTFQQAKQTDLLPAMGCMFITATAFAMVTALFTLFTEHRFGWQAKENGLLFAYIGLIGVLLQGVFLGKLLKRFNEKKLILLGCGTLAASLLALSQNTSLLVLYLASSGMAIGNGLFNPVLNGWASQSTDAQSQGAVMGLMQSTASLGRLIGPILGGILLQYESVHQELTYGSSPFLIGGLLLVGSLMLGLQLKAKGRPIHLES